MSIQSEIERIKGNIFNTYRAAENGGVELPEEQNSDNLAGTIAAGLENLTTILDMWGQVTSLYETYQGLQAQIEQKQETIRTMSPIVEEWRKSIVDAISFMFGTVSDDASFEDFADAIKTIPVPFVARGNQLIETFDYVESVRFASDTRGTENIYITTKNGITLAEEMSNDIKQWAKQYVYNVDKFFYESDIDKIDEYTQIVVLQETE